MAKQTMTYPDNGSRSERILELLTPMTGVTAPAVHAEYIGQVFVDTVLGAVYISVATDSVSAADDWVALAPVV